jgi:hypothetical protein
VTSVGAKGGVKIAPQAQPRELTVFRASPILGGYHLVSTRLFRFHNGRSTQGIQSEA